MTGSAPQRTSSDSMGIGVKATAAKVDWVFSSSASNTINSAVPEPSNPLGVIIM